MYPGKIVGIGRKRNVGLSVNLYTGARSASNRGRDVEQQENFMKKRRRTCSLSRKTNKGTGGFRKFSKRCERIRFHYRTVIGCILGTAMNII